MIVQYLLTIFQRQGDALLASLWLPGVTEEEVRRVFSIPPEEWHGYEFEVVTEGQRVWLAGAVPDLEVEWDVCVAYVGLARV